MGMNVLPVSMYADDGLVFRQMLPNKGLGNF